MELSRDLKSEIDAINQELTKIAQRQRKELDECKEACKSVLSLTKAEFDDYCKTSIRYTSKLVASHSSIYLVLLTDLPPHKQELAVDINAVRKFAASFTHESFIEKILHFVPRGVDRVQL